MRIKIAVGLVLCAVAAAAATGARQEAVEELTPDVWVKEGDNDGDGLGDAFEEAHGLDPKNASSFADNVPDESRVAPSGRTYWEEQQASAQPGSGGDSVGACGAMGLEALLVLLLAKRARGSGRA